ncbi:MAG: energy transducer TonB [Terracidiphilus sp.]
MARKFFFALVFTFLLSPVNCLDASAQNAADHAVSTSALAASYPNTEAGFRQFLSDYITTAKTGNLTLLNSAVEATDIPDYEHWFLKTYPGPGESWIEPYAKGLNNNHILMKNLLTYIAQQEGELVVRKVKENPQGDKGMEWGMLHAAALPVDLYNARWKQLDENPGEKHDLLVGYFYYIDGGFRWDSNIREVSGPKYRVDPIYPYPTDGKHPAGKIMLKFNILINGSVSKSDISVLQPNGFSTDAKLVEAAKTAVEQWRYWPPNLFGVSNDVNKIAIINVAPPANTAHGPQEKTK